MKTEYLKPWVAALRSGKFVQGKRFLHTESLNDTKEGYCCLGVLCEINNIPKIAVTAGNHEVKYYVYTYKPEDKIRDNSSTSLPYSFMQEVELNLEQTSNLMRLNDVLKYSFDQIADWIENNLQK